MEMFNIELLLEATMYGLVIGGIYSLMALSLTLIWGICEVWDTAQSQFYTLGAYLAWTLVNYARTNFFIALFISAATVALLSTFNEKFNYKFLRGKPQERMLVAFGTYLLIQNLIMVIWTPKTKTLNVPHQNVLISISSISISIHRILIISVGTVLFLLIYQFIKRTKLGKAIRAMAQNSFSAQLMGIDIDVVNSIVFALAGASSATAGALLAPIFAVYPTMGGMPIVKATVVIVLGGLGSIPGAILGGYILGIVESLGAVFISIAYQNAFAFFILVAVLVLRPYGMFGKEERKA